MQNMRIEMVGGVHGHVAFKLDAPRPARDAILPGEKVPLCVSSAITAQGCCELHNSVIPLSRELALCVMCHAVDQSYQDYVNSCLVW